MNPLDRGHMVRNKIPSAENRGRADREGARRSALSRPKQNSSEEKSYMKGKTGKTKAIVMSALTIGCCGALIVGATVAAFTSSQEYSFNVQSGEISISSALTLDSMSYRGEADSDATSVADNAQGDGNASENAITLENGYGSAAVNGEQITMTLAQGTTADFTLTVENASTVAMKYVAYLSLDGNASTYTFDGGVMNGTGSSYFLTQTEGVGGWVTAGTAQGQIAELSFRIGLAWGAASSVNSEITLVVRAVQANAFTGNANFDGDDYGTLTEAIEAAAESEEAEVVLSAGDGVHELDANAFDALSGKSVVIEGYGDALLTTSDDAPLALPQNVTLRNLTIENGVTVGAQNGLAARTRSQGQVALENVAVQATGKTALNVQGATLIMKDSSVRANGLVASADAAAMSAVVVSGGGAVFENTSFDIDYDNDAVNDETPQSQAMHFNGAQVTFTDCEISIDFSNAASYQICGMLAEQAAEVTFAGNTNYILNDEEQDQEGADAMRVRTKSAVLMKDSAQMVVPSGPVLGTGARVVMTDDAGIEAYLYGLDGNNTNGTMTIELSGNASVISHDGTGIYVPNAATLTMEGNAYVKGLYAGIDAKMGTLNLIGGTIECNGEAELGTRPANGINPSGSAVTLHSHGYGVNPSQGDYAEVGAINALNVTLGAGLQLVCKGEFPVSYYDWATKSTNSNWVLEDGRIAQDVTIVNESGYEIFAIGTDVYSINRLFREDAECAWYEGVHFLGGDGKSDFTGDLGDVGRNDVLHVWTAAALADLGKVSGNIVCDIVLEADIDLSGTSWTPIGQGMRSGSGLAEGGKSFSGTFDGNGKTVSNLTFSGAYGDDNAFGLIGVLNGGVVKDLTLANVSVNVTDGECVGAVVGLMINGATVSGVTVESGSVTAVRGNGGIVGRMTVSGTIENCNNHASITATSVTSGNVGGIVGAAYYTGIYADESQAMHITNCTNTGTVTAACMGAGGIVGLSSAYVSGCTNSGTVKGNGASIGGIVGEQQNYGAVTDCVNTANIVNTNTAAYGTGGIVGWIRYSGAVADYQTKAPIQVIGCSNSGTIDGGNDGGGIVGTLYDAGLVQNCLNEAERIQGETFAAGIVGNLQVWMSNDKPAEIPVPEGSTLKRGALIVYNISTTTEDRITVNGACKDLFAYNNDSQVFFVGVNYTNTEDAEQKIARVDDQLSFKNALGSVEEGGTIVLEADVVLRKTGNHPSGTSNSYIAIPNVTIDLGGHTVTVEPIGSGISVYGSVFGLAANGITLKNGIVQQDSYENSAYPLYVTSGAKNVLIDNVTLRGGVQVVGNSTATLRNVTITAQNWYCVYLEYNSTCTIESGTFTRSGNQPHIYTAQSSDTVIVNGGIFDGSTTPAYGGNGQLIDNTLVSE